MESISEAEPSADGGNDSCNSTFTKEQVDEILIALGSTGITSLLVCSVAVVMVIWLHLCKIFAYRLALYQVLAALFFSLTLSLELLALHYNSGSTYSRRVCEAVGFLTQYSTWVKLMFTVCLTFHLFCLAVFFKNYQKLEVAYVLLSVLFPLLHAWIPFLHKSFGMSGAWCWIRGWEDDCATKKYEVGLIEQFALWYGPFFTVALIDTLAITIMGTVLVGRACLERKHASGDESQPLLRRKVDQRKEALRQMMPLLVYPLLFLVLILFALVDRVYGALAKDVSYALTVVHAVVGLSWGLFAGLALILHLCLLREWSRKKRRKVVVQAPAKQQALATTLHSPLKFGVATHTSGHRVLGDADPSTATTTRHSTPAESGVDERMGVGGSPF